MGRDLLFTIGPERKEKPMKNQYSAGQARHKDPSQKTLRMTQRLSFRAKPRNPIPPNSNSPTLPT